MKLLFLTPQLPYPPISGGVIKSHQLLLFLAEHYQLTMGCLLKGQADEHNLSQLQAILGQVTIISQPVNIARTAANFIKSCLLNQPLTIYRNTNADFGARIAAIASQHPVIVVDHYLMVQYVPKNYQGRVVVHQHNAEFMMWSRMAQQTAFGVKKALLQFEAARIRRYEVKMCEQADAVLAAPNDQQALIEAGAVTAQYYDTYHLGDEDNLNCPPLQFAQTQLKLLFIGTLTWEANIDGLLWFLQTVWPQIKSQVPQVTFTIVGKHNADLAAKLLQLDPELNLLGFVDDLEVLYQQHRVFVAPLRFGSGIKVKVVNGLYRGIPTVTTRVGAEGMDVISGEHLYIADDPTGFVQAVVTLLQDKDKWQQLSNQSRQLMAQKYTWAAVFENVTRSIRGE